jgi:hypothetical protein
MVDSVHVSATAVTLDNYCRRLSTLSLSSTDQALAILYWLSANEPQNIVTAGRLSQVIREFRLGSPHSTRLGKQLERCGKVLKQRNGYRLKAIAESEIASLLLPIFSSASVSVESTDFGSVIAGGKAPCIFLGHGRSSNWRELKDFIHDKLHLNWEEFNRVPQAGRSTKERLEELMTKCTFAFIIMTGEDEHADRSIHARENVIHEAGLFQGRLGFGHAVILLEAGCNEFSNIHGLVQIRFPKGNVRAVFQDVRELLEHRGLIAAVA